MLILHVMITTRERTPDMTIAQLNCYQLSSIKEVTTTALGISQGFYKTNLRIKLLILLKTTNKSPI